MNTGQAMSLFAQLLRISGDHLDGADDLLIEGVLLQPYQVLNQVVNERLCLPSILWLRFWMFLANECNSLAQGGH